MSKSSDPKSAKSKPKEMKGAKVLVECLERQGVKTIFAYPGGASLELHQALCGSGVAVVLPRHEQGGAFAAAGYSRITGGIGVCMATSGPGATNLLTGVADAYMDSIPLVVITGQVSSTLIGRTAFQEIDIIGMTRPIVKHSYLVLDAKDIPQVVAEAFYLANSGRPGPVVVDIPKNVQQQLVTPVFATGTPSIRGYQPLPKASDAEVANIMEAVRKSRKPCIYAGGGIISANASEALTRFARANQIPVTTTLMGIGCFPETDPLSLKWLGMHGTVYANNAANECDLLLAFGARFDDRVTGPTATFARDAFIVHVDIDGSEINKNKKAALGVVSDIKSVLDALNQFEPVKPAQFAAWRKQVDQWKRQFPLSYAHKNKVLPQQAIEFVDELSGGQAVMVPGVGQHQMWTAQCFKYTRPRQLLTSGGLGAMGFGFPTAIGAKIARPDLTIVCVEGDGSFQMNIQELGTVNTYGVDLKIMILNNQHLGMVAQWEDRFYGSQRGNTVLANEHSDRPYPDFVTIAKGYLIPGREVYRKDELKDAVREMLETPGPFLLDVHIQYQEHVLPMIPPGKDYKAIITE